MPFKDKIVMELHAPRSKADNTSIK